MMARRIGMAWDADQISAHLAQPALSPSGRARCRPGPGVLGRSTLRVRLDSERQKLSRSCNPRSPGASTG